MHLIIISAAIESAPWRNGRTRLGNALAYVLANELVCEQGDRPHVPNVVLVLTDGMSQDDPSTIAKQMHLLVGIKTIPDKNDRNKFTGKYYLRNRDYRRSERRSTGEYRLVNESCVQVGQLYRSR